jgi:hypothetical protein
LLSPQNICAAPNESAPPTLYRDVLPILQNHCQACHRAGEIAPMPLITYAQIRPLARAIADAVAKKALPPWFADPTVGHFSNDPTLTQEEIATLKFPRQLARWLLEIYPCRFRSRIPDALHDARPPRHRSNQRGHRVCQATTQAARPHLAIKPTTIS